VATGQLIRAYQTVSSGQVAWSPDAGYLAYVEATSNLIGIIDVQSGQLVFTYRGHSAQVDVCQLAWSPNGKYIVSGECQGQTTVVRVWTAGFAKE
jgi:WD40 repeat protein